MIARKRVIRRLRHNNYRRYLGRKAPWTGDDLRTSGPAPSNYIFFLLPKTDQTCATTSSRTSNIHTQIIEGDLERLRRPVFLFGPLVTLAFGKAQLGSHAENGEPAYKPNLKAEKGLTSLLPSYPTCANLRISHRADRLTKNRRAVQRIRSPLRQAMPVYS